jgi:hypothetical protein
MAVKEQKIEVEGEVEGRVVRLRPVQGRIT